ncbi:MAG: hypothetical protein M3P43_17970 [Actinomycetota bacterium]|nr:hypothetical protein [Actinomycetota bacterium]
MTWPSSHESRFVLFKPERVALAESLLAVHNLLVIALPLMWLFAER